MTCPRSITFTLDTAGSPRVQIQATEGPGGTLDMVVQVLTSPLLTADLRGLFFDLADDAKLAGLAITEPGPHRVTDFDTVDVISLKNGANMSGAAAPFDAGLEIGTAGSAKDDIQSLAFTLSNGAGNLTLDDLAHVDFGVRLTSIGAPGSNKRSEKDGAKLVTLSPAAPDAHNDTFSLFEDGAAGLQDARSSAQGVVLPVLANDTDADAGSKLSVLHVEGAAHGSLAIVDGPDADSLPGDAVLYTPDTDFSGSDSFSYCVSDGQGGVDSASVSLSVVAVADLPQVTVQVVDAVDAVNQVRLLVTTRSTDDDGSETVSAATPALPPAGVSLSPLGAPVLGPQGQVSQAFMATLPADADVNYSQQFLASAVEASNADAQAGSGAVQITQVQRSSSLNVALTADDASLWADGQGPQAQILGPLMGIEAGPDLDLYPYPLRYELQATVHAGFQPFLSIEGGTLDARLDYEVNVDSTHNRSTDTLLIRAAADLTGGTLATHGPGGHMGIDFVFGYDVGLKLGLDFDADLGDTLEVNLLDLHESDQWTLANLIDLHDSEPGFGLDGSLFNGTSGSVQWPQVNIAGGSFDAASGVVKGQGAAPFMSVQSDLDALLTGAVVGNVSPFDMPISMDLDVDPLPDVAGFLRLLDLDVGAQLKLAQQFELSGKSFQGTLTFENGQSMPLVFGQDLLIQNALATYDALAAGGDGDGRVEYSISFDGAMQVRNVTEVQVEKSIDYKLLELDIDYDLDFVVDQFEGGFHDALVHVSEASVSVVGVVDQSFTLDALAPVWTLDAGA